MNFNNHLNLKGKHAFLSASKYHWIHYDDEKLDATYNKFLAIQRGTELHEVASELIRLGIKLPRSSKTLNLYVNDAIGYKMSPEQVLYYSDNCFGTADAISFQKGKLRIHDLKTGETPASMHQLEVYAGLFCLEYKVRPGEIEKELRIYQSDSVQVHMPSDEDIAMIMDKIVSFDKRIDHIKKENQ